MATRGTRWPRRWASPRTTARHRPCVRLSGPCAAGPPRTPATWRGSAPRAASACRTTARTTPTPRTPSGGTRSTVPGGGAPSRRTGRGVSAELVPHTVGPLPSTAAPAGGRHDVDIDLAEWPLEYRSDNTRLTYANVLSTRWHPLTGQPRDTSGLLNGLAWLPLCERAGLHPYEATRRDVLAWLDALATTPQQRGRGAGQPLGKASRANALSALAAYYGWLVERGR